MSNISNDNLIRCYGKHDAGRLSVDAEGTSIGIICAYIIHFHKIEVAGVGFCISLLCATAEGVIASNESSMMKSNASMSDKTSRLLQYIAASTITPQTVSSRTKLAAKHFLLNNIEYKSLIDHSVDSCIQLKVIGKIRTVISSVTLGLVCISACLAYREGLKTYEQSVYNGNVPVRVASDSSSGSSSSSSSNGIVLRLGDAASVIDQLDNKRMKGRGVIPVLLDDSRSNSSAFHSTIQRHSNNGSQACYLNLPSVPYLLGSIKNTRPIIIQSVGGKRELHQAQSLSSKLAAVGLTNTEICHIDTTADGVSSLDGNVNVINELNYVVQSLVTMINDIESSQSQQNKAYNGSIIATTAAPKSPMILLTTNSTAAKATATASDDGLSLEVPLTYLEILGTAVRGYLEHARSLIASVIADSTDGIVSVYKYLSSSMGNQYVWMSAFSSKSYTLSASYLRSIETWFAPKMIVYIDACDYTYCQHPSLIRRLRDAVIASGFKVILLKQTDSSASAAATVRAGYVHDNSCVLVFRRTDDSAIAAAAMYNGKTRRAIAIASMQHQHRECYSLESVRQAIFDSN